MPPNCFILEDNCSLVIFKVWSPARNQEMAAFCGMRDVLRADLMNCKTDANCSFTSCLLTSRCKATHWVPTKTYPFSCPFILYTHIQIPDTVRRTSCSLYPSNGFIADCKCRPGHGEVPQHLASHEISLSLSR